MPKCWETCGNCRYGESFLGWRYSYNHIQCKNPNSPNFADQLRVIDKCGEYKKGVQYSDR